jgi:hypothetical protein
MGMAQRRAGPGELMVRARVSAEPWTAPRRGFPQLLLTGESYGGRAIVDAQHPHDLFMELAASYTIPITEHTAVHFYCGPVGEPALGPVAFMHRASALENPSAPLGHHWQDSTHIGHGVVTAGVTAWKLRLEGSMFRGAEPDEERRDIELGKIDSWSARVWFAPTRNWAVQYSHGHLVQPELLAPGNLVRRTASISHTRAWQDGSWSTTALWGRNRELHGISNSYLLESTVNFLDRNYAYTRLELVDKAMLGETNIFGRPGIPHGAAGHDHQALDRVGAFTFGAVRDIVATKAARIGLGADLTLYHLTDRLRPVYGSRPVSASVFLRLRPGKMQH